MHALAHWTERYATTLEDGRGHAVVVDLPVHEGGTSAGTSALELCVLSLAGCITTIFAVVARKRRLDFHALHLAMEAERDRGAPTVSRVRGTLRIRTRASADEVATALRLTLKSCPVGVLFARAQVPVDVGIIVEPIRPPG
jgi:putative redox protein